MHHNHQSTLKTNHDRPPSNYDLYQQILEFNNYQAITTHNQHSKIFKKFIQHPQYKILFIFGPSGCGKHTFIHHKLTVNNIKFVERRQVLSLDDRVVDSQYEMQIEGPVNKLTSLKQMILNSLTQSYTSSVQVYEDFPITSFDSGNDLQSNVNFKKEFYYYLRQAQCKIIFILNSDIYNSFYIETCEPAPSVISIRMKPYTNTQNKTILKHFCTFYPQLSYIFSSKEELDEILQIGNGDARKTLVNVYYDYMKKKVTVNGCQDNKNNKKKLVGTQKSKHKLQLKNQKKISLFHLLGKFLYAKRLDVSNMKDRLFTRNQLIEIDPPFYFDPIQIFLKSNIPLNIFSDLLFENYVQRYGSIEDCMQMLEIFSWLDYQFPYYVTKKRGLNSIEKEQQLYIFMLNWGIILKNKDAFLNKKGFSSFHKAKHNQIYREATHKRNIIQKYFLNSNVAHWTKFAYIVRNSRITKEYLVSKLLNKTMAFRSSLSQEAMGISEEQQQNEGIVLSVNEEQIRKIVTSNKMAQKKHDNMMKELMDELEGSDSDISSD